MNKFISIIIILYSILIQSAVSMQPGDINGKWIFKYNASYGYEFSFTNSKFADIIIFMKSNFLLFKGIYQIKDTNTINIEVLEMKYSPSLSDIRSGKELTKTSSSRIIFKGQKSISGGKSYLILTTESVKIDGNSSEGFFDPEIKLKKE